MPLVNLTFALPSSRPPLTEAEAGELLERLGEDPLHSAVVLAVNPQITTVTLDVEAPSIEFAINHATALVRRHFAQLGREVTLDLKPFGSVSVNVEVVLP